MAWQAIAPPHAGHVEGIDPRLRASSSARRCGAAHAPPPDRSDPLLSDRAPAVAASPHAGPSDERLRRRPPTRRGAPPRPPHAPPLCADSPDTPSDVQDSAERTHCRDARAPLLRPRPWSGHDNARRTPTRRSALHAVPAARAASRARRTTPPPRRAPGAPWVPTHAMRARRSNAQSESAPSAAPLRPWPDRPARARRQSPPRRRPSPADAAHPIARE